MDGLGAGLKKTRRAAGPGATRTAGSAGDVQRSVSFSSHCHV